jgi:BASS family bile acid:Na+ symporter
MNPANLVSLLTVTGLVAMMLAMGLRVPAGEVVASSRRPWQVASSLLANFVLVPAVTAGLLRWVDPDPMVSVGFLILAVCPGAPVGPPFAAVAKGDVPYAIGQMVILAGLSAVLSPLLLGVLLTRTVPDTDLQIDYLSIARSLLLSQMLPLAAGLALHSRASGLAERIAKPVGRLANVLLLVAVTLVLASQFGALSLIRVRGWAGMLALLAASLAIGWICGGPRRATRKSLAVTTAARNAAVALVIVSGNFAETPAVTAVVAYALVSIFGTFGCALLFGALPAEPPFGRPGQAPAA